MPRAGALDRRIKITRMSSTKGADGIAKKQLQEIATVWAEYKPGVKDEQYSAEQTTAAADAEFVIRWSNQVKDLKAKDAIHYAGDIYELVSAPVEIDRREFLSLKVRLKVANA